MDPDESLQEGMSIPGTKLQHDGQEKSSENPQRVEKVQHAHSETNPAQITQGQSGKTSEGRQKPIRTPGNARRIQVRNQEASRGRPQEVQAANMAPSIINQTQGTSQEDSNFEARGPRRTLSTPVGEIEYTSTSDLEQKFKQQYANLEQLYKQVNSEKKQLINRIQSDSSVIGSLQGSLQESESQRLDLQQRLEEASNTIFRLRPQREEYTESEIEENYEKLIKAVKNWVNISCESFVDDDVRGFDVLGRRRAPQDVHLEAFEYILMKFRSHPKRWMEAKEHVLVAVVMRYLYERILNQDFSFLLHPEEREFLADIQMGMGDARLEKDLLTIRTWRSDTIAAVNNLENFTNRRPSIEERLTLELHNFLQGALSGEDSKSTMHSLYKEVIVPASELAHKTQSASSIWLFRYSAYFGHKPEQFGSTLPNFLATIQEFRCVNMSNRDRPLKPPTDLATREQRESLLYMLDLFPGLYCQRVTAGNCLPVSTVSQPILLIAFANDDTHAHTQQHLSAAGDPETSTQNRKTPPARPTSTGRSRGILSNWRTTLGFSE